MNYNDQVILKKLEELYSQQNKLRLSLRNGLPPPVLVSPDLDLRSLVPSSGFKDFRITFKSFDSPPLPRPQDKSEVYALKHATQKRSQRYDVRSVVGRKNLFKLNLTEKHRKHDKSQYDKGKEGGKFIEQRFLLMRLALAHNLYLQHRLEDNTFRRRLVLGPGNNSALLQHIFQKKGFWRVQHLKKIISSGQLIVEKDGQKIIRKYSQVSLLWTQECQHNFLAALDVSFKPYLDLVCISREKRKDSTVSPQLHKLFQDSDIAQGEAFAPKPSVTEHEYCVASNQLAKKRQGTRYLQWPYPLHNHFRLGNVLGDKKRLLLAMRQYCALNQLSIKDILPESFIVECSDFSQIPEEQRRQHWIYKPGEHSNRGNGIQVFLKLEEAVEHCKRNPMRSAIIQKYIQNPMLFKGRKFDIRCYVLLANLNNLLRGYWYEEGYVRTSSAEFTLKKTSKFIHLTNDAIQNRGEHYGQYQKCNKLSFKELDEYLAKEGKHADFISGVLPKLKQLARLAIRASYPLLRANKSQHEFQIFGLDFMVDDLGKPWLIEVNTNPCLATPCLLLERLIGGMLENALRLAVDPLHQPPLYKLSRSTASGESFLEGNKFSLIFDQKHS